MLKILLTFFQKIIKTIQRAAFRHQRWPKAVAARLGPSLTLKLSRRTNLLPPPTPYSNGFKIILYSKGRLKPPLTPLTDGQWLRNGMGRK